MKRAPTTGYHTEIDVSGGQDREQSEQIVRDLRTELNPKGIHVSVVTMENCNGNIEVRLSTPSQKTALREWLRANDYDDEVVNARNPNTVSRARV